MGRKRRNGKKNRTQQGRNYVNSWRSKTIDNALHADEFRQKQSKFHKEFAEKEKDILSRSIFVTGVMDLKVPSNLEALEIFFVLNYGSVKVCKVVDYQNKRRSPRHSFPPARVEFFYKRDAERVFGNKPLSSVQQSVEINCPVGFRNGKILVRPSMPSNDLLLEETEGTQIKLAADRLILGHWCPGESEMENLGDGTFEPDVWLEVDKGPQPVVMIDLKERYIVLTHTHITHTDRIMFTFKELSSPISLCKEKGSGQISLVFSLKQPPKVHKKDFFVFDGFMLDLEKEFERSLRWETLSANALGYCLGYKLLVSEAQIEKLILHNKFNQLRDCGVLGFDNDALQNPNHIDSKLVGYNYDQDFDRALAKIHNFEIASWLNMLRSAGKITAYHAMTDKASFPNMGMVNIMDALKSISGSTFTRHAILTLEKMTTAPGFTKYPSRLFTHLLPDAASSETTPLPGHCILVPHVRLSPLRVSSLGMGIETSNRAIRHFTNTARHVMSKGEFKVDMFLRVSITEENGAQFSASELTRTVRERFRTALVEGIELCGRKYVFLAYSSSQLTECSAWMVHQPKGWTVAQMRKELGDFSRCKTASKLGARLGQCFSTTFTQSTRNQFRISYVEVQDIEGSKGCHSDGTGMISRKALDDLLLELPIGPKDPREVSIVQIRFGGAKGTLTAYENPTEYLPLGTPRVDVFIRPSMIKFDGKFSGVEVCSIGKNVPYYLNRNVILLLVAHGVDEDLFLAMQNHMLEDLDKMLDDREVALRLVPSLTGAGNELRKTLVDMLSAGLSPENEPYLYDCLSAMRNHQLFALRKKSRILVEQGAVLVGGLDETRLVPEGCVFFQVGASPFVGRVLVTKHPVMHPGDVRMMLAIDIPALRHHRNMILFSQHGERPEADKMSGSDLDGDEFAVTWDERLFIRENKEPMNYEGKDTASLSGLSGDPENVTDELVRHFLNHIENAKVGQIAMLWLDHAAGKGADCTECIELAGLHSVAVDYPKSGVPAQIPQHLKLPASVPRAHWREKKGSPSYECDSVIGKLYNQVKAARRHENKVAVAGRKVDQYGTIVVEVRRDWSPNMLRHVYNPRIPMALMALEFPPTMSSISSDLQALAKEERVAYEDELIQLMNKYKIRGEGETHTGCIRKFHKFWKKRQHDFTQEIRRRGSEIRKRFRKSFFENVVQVSDKLQGIPASDMVQALSKFQFDDAEEEGKDIPTEEDEDFQGDSDGPGDIGTVISLDDDRVRELEQIVTKDPDICSEAEMVVQLVAFGLAAAYYNATYHYEHRWTDRDHNVTLYSFPWLIADVITCAYRFYHGAPSKF